MMSDLRILVKYYKVPDFPDDPMQMRIGYKYPMITKSIETLQQYDEDKGQWIDVPRVEVNDE